MTPDKIIDTYFSDGLPAEEIQGNKDWLRDMHNTLKEGGTWICPALGKIFEKKGDEFKELTIDDA